MKKNLTILLSSFVLVALISCNNVKPSSHSKNSNDPSIEDSSIIVTSSDVSITSSVEQSSSKDESTTSVEEETYYHVTFVNYDDSVLYEVDVLEGSAATYSGVDPVKEEDDEFTYEFIGWDIDLSSITSDITAKAQYNPVAKENWGPIIWF